MSVFVLLDMNGLSVVIPILDIVAELLPDNFAYTLQVMVSFGSALVGQSNDMSMLLELAFTGVIMITVINISMNPIIFNKPFFILTHPYYVISISKKYIVCK